jgi:hypothetical protein
MPPKLLAFIQQKLCAKAYSQEWTMIRDMALDGAILSARAQAAHTIGEGAHARQH